MINLYCLTSYERNFIITFTSTFYNLLIIQCVVIYMYKDCYNIMNIMNKR